MLTMFDCMLMAIFWSLCVGVNIPLLFLAIYERSKKRTIFGVVNLIFTTVCLYTYFWKFLDLYSLSNLIKLN